MSDLVIAREYRGKPLKRIALETKNGLVYLANPEMLDAIDRGASSPVGFPQEDVFAYDNELFEKMRAAYERGGSEPSLWQAMSRFQVAEA